MMYNDSVLGIAAAEADMPIRSNLSFTCNHVNLYYGEFQALKDINLKIERNKITALIGPSGCGKSTFLRTLNRMNDLVPGCRVDGEIMLDGVDA